MKCYRVVGAAVISLCLVSCGGGGDAGPPPSPVLTGVFIDSPVQDLPYTSTPSGLSGRTGPNGEFQYRQGDEITFFGGTAFLRTIAQPVLTPFAVLSRRGYPDVDDEWTMNLTRVLLALDTTPGLGVLTMPTPLPAIPGSMFFATTESEFLAQLASSGLPVIPRSTAAAHLKEQFAIWGSWTSTGSASELQVFTFLPDGTYLLAHDDDPSLSGGKDGMERGTYRWSPATNVFSYSVAVDTDGTGGLSNPSSTQVPPYAFVIDPSGDSAILRLGPNGSDEIQLRRVSSSVNALVGGWKLTDPPPGAGSYVVVTFLDDGSFMVASDSVDGEPAGIERGTYVLANGQLTLTTRIDTNGQIGFNESPGLPALATAQVQLSEVYAPDLDRMRLGDGTGSNDVFFTRVKVP